MRCAPALVLRASSSVRQAIRQLESASEHADVVLVREHAGELLYYVFSAGGLRARLSPAQPDIDVASVIMAVSPMVGSMACHSSMKDFRRRSSSGIEISCSVRVACMCSWKLSGS